MKWYLSVLILIIISLLGVGLWLLGQETPGLTVTSITSTTTPGSVKITPLQGAVSISTTTTSEFYLISKDMMVDAGTKIKTGISGRALVESSSAHKTLVDYNTDLMITDDLKTEKATRITLFSGALWARLTKIFDLREVYEIKTSNTSVTVRGTSFGLWYSSGTTRVIVIEGSVVFSKIDEATQENIPGSEVLVNSGYKAVRTGNGDIKVSKITEADTGSAWYTYNNPTGRIVPSVNFSGSEVINQLQPEPPLINPNLQEEEPLDNTSDKFKIINITPVSIKTGSNSIISIKGDGFLQIKALIIGEVSIQDYQILGPTLIQLSLPNLTPGLYDIILVSLDNKVAESPNKLNVTAQ